MSTNGETENHGNGYFIYFRLSTSSSRVEFYRVENDSYSQNKCIDLPLDTTYWHNVKLIYDRTNGKSSIYYDGRYYGSYTDANFFTEGNIVALRNGGATAHIDDFRIYRSRGNSASITSGENGDIQAPANIEGNQDFAIISSIAIDSAQNIAYYNYAIVNDTTTVNISDEELGRIALYPSPNNGNFTLNVTHDLVGKYLTIYDINGRIILVRKAESEKIEISLGEVASGTYFAKIGTDKIKFTIK